jgi:hypothetical protein
MESPESGSILLARKINRARMMDRKRLLPIIQQEIGVLRRLKHKHIIQIVSTYETTCIPRQFGILIHPAGDEDLHNFLERAGENDFPEKDVASYETGNIVSRPRLHTSTKRTFAIKILNQAISSAKTTKYS